MRKLICFLLLYAFVIPKPCWAQLFGTPQEERDFYLNQQALEDELEDEFIARENKFLELPQEKTGQESEEEDPVGDVESGDSQRENIFILNSDYPGNNQERLIEMEKANQENNYLNDRERDVTEEGENFIRNLLE